jgi:thiamine-phosphate pyrophosphorylase
VNLPRLYPILDTAALQQRGCTDWAVVAETWLEAGAEIIQLRHKQHWTRAAYIQATDVASRCESFKSTFIVNDRADFAKLLNAGLHVGQDDLSPVDSRKVLGAEAKVGFSTHNIEQLSAAASEPVDYLAFGPIFSTVSKTRPDPTVGLKQLREARSATTKPLVAIGGITLDRAREVLDQGADSVAVIAGLLPDKLDESSLRQRMEAWLQRTRQ